jgi:hypothetical protein
MPPYFEIVKVSKTATVMKTVPLLFIFKVQSLMIDLFIQVFRRCTIHGTWSRDAIFLGSFRWIGTDVRYVRSFFDVSIVRWVRATCQWTGMSITVPKS